jgi:uncharacterized protein YraI
MLEVTYMKRLGWSAVVSLLLAAPLAVYAADGYVTGNVNMRAGPDVGYPLVDQLPAGTGVSVQGCTGGWEWCDVISSSSGSRGWVAGNFIQYQYQNQPVLLPAYGAQIGIPIVSFVIGTYWNNYYRSRPFYSQRNTWYSRPMPHRPPPRPINRPGQGQRPPPARPRPPVNRPTPRPQPPANNRPKPQPRPAVTRPQPRPQPNQRPQQQRPAPGNGQPARPAGNRPATPPKGQQQGRPKPSDDKGGQ